MRYYLKKYTPVYLAGAKICIGYPRKKKYIELENTDMIYNQLKKIICDGIKKESLNHWLYRQMLDFNFLEELNTYKETSDCDRDSLYFDYLGCTNFNDKIRDNKILVFGAGALGSTITYKLAQSKFRNITVIDFDTISRTDTLKSSVFGRHDIGQKKIDILQKRIKEQFNIRINVIDAEYTSYEEIENQILCYTPNLILKACDPELAFRVHLNRAAFKYNIPFLTFAYAFEILRLGPFYMPGVTSCDDYLNQLQKKYYGEHYDFLSDRKLFVNHLVHPATSFNVSFLAAFALKEILMFLTEQYEYCITLGRLIEFNPLSLQYNYFDLSCDDKCKICQ